MNIPSIQKLQKKSCQLDCIKAIAIIMIVAFHFWGQLSGWHMRVVKSDWLATYFQNFNFEKLLHFMEAYLYLGVNLFIIASGFGLYLSYIREGKVFQWNRFLKKRLIRLIPAAIISIIFVFFFKGFFLNNWTTGHPYLNIFPFFAGLNLLSDQWFFPPINGETWFLGLIIQLYLLFGPMTWLYEKVRKPQVQTLISSKKFGTAKFLGLLFMISTGFRVWYYISLQYSVSSLSYGFFLGRIFEFGFGMICAENFYLGKNISRWWLLGLLVFWGYFFPLTFPFTDSLLGIGLFTLLWLIASNLQTTKNNFIKTAQSFDTLNDKTSCSKNITYKKPSQSLAEKLSAQSYMIFLIHHPLIWLLNKWGLINFWNFKGILLFLVLFLASYKIAYFLNHILCLVSVTKKPLKNKFS